MPAFHRNNRRRFRRLGLLFAIAFILNLLVAWGLSLIPHINSPGNYRSVQMLNPNFDGKHSAFFYNEQQWFGVLEQQYHTQRRSRTQQTQHRISFWWAWSPLTPEPDILSEGNRLFALHAPQHPDETVISSARYGFPALTIRCVTLVTDPIPGSTTKPSVIAHGAVMDENAIPITVINAALGSKSAIWPHATYIWLPYHPIWSGLVINTMIYALFLWVLLYLLRSIKHDRRLHRGTCPYCAYDLGFNYTSGCPECGWRRSSPENG